jgi:hypothetical protein
MKHANLFMKAVMKKALQIEHYWGCVEFASGRGDIHLHIVAMVNNRAYLQEFYNASSLHQKAEVLNNYAIHHLPYSTGHKHHLKAQVRRSKSSLFSCQVKCQESMGCTQD